MPYRLSNGLQLTDSPNYEVAPSFSQDGKRIVFAAGNPGDRADHLFTVGVDGRSLVQLTDIDANDTAPRFSPDGLRIVFARDKTYNWGAMAARDNRTSQESHLHNPLGRNRPTANYGLVIVRQSNWMEHA